MTRSFQISLAPSAVADLFLVRCRMQHAEIPEGMVNLAHAFVEAQHLRAWFYALERLPVSVRETAFSEMAAQMRNAGEDPRLTDAVASLANPKTYQSVLETVRERVGNATPDI